MERLYIQALCCGGDFQSSPDVDHSGLFKSHMNWTLILWNECIYRLEDRDSTFSTGDRLSEKLQIDFEDPHQVCSKD